MKTTFQKIMESFHFTCMFQSNYYHNQITIRMTSYLVVYIDLITNKLFIQCTPRPETVETKVITRMHAFHTTHS